MIDLEKYGYNSDSIDLILKNCEANNRNNVSALNPLFKQLGIWDALHIDEILRSSSESENEFHDLVQIVNQIGYYKVCLVDLVKRNDPVDLPDSNRIVAFPGLAATERVFSGVEFGDLKITTVDYRNIDFSKNADTVVDEIISKYSISSEHILLGTSFGGFLVNRISSVLKTKHVLMLGALANASELGYLRRVAIRSKAFKLISISKMSKRIVKHLFGIKTEECEKAFYEMLSLFSDEVIFGLLDFIRKCEDIKCNATVRIHGKDDFLIPKPEAVNEYFPAGHIITMKENGSKIISIGKYNET